MHLDVYGPVCFNLAMVKEIEFHILKLVCVTVDLDGMWYAFETF